MSYELVRAGLFQLPPEVAHSLTLAAVRAAGKLGLRRTELHSPVNLMGLSFPNRIGLAAGFDKNGTAIDGGFALGFGHIEVGTVTPRPQAGNPKPRVFRIPEHGAIINRMGFPNDGAERVAARLSSRRSAGIVGVNIGKNAATPMERAVDDYVNCFRALYPVADYMTVNVSSPNTAGLRSLQDSHKLAPLLSALLEESKVLESRHSRHVPLLVKISPDLSEEELRQSALAAASVPVAGIVATNTTLSRDGVIDSPISREPGGLSGPPLAAKARNAVRILREAVGPGMTIVGVGGVSSAADARLMQQAGADLVQVYAGLVYKGPRLIRAVLETMGK